MFDTGFETIPTNLEDLQPGPELGGVLACIDINRLSPFDRVRVLEARQRMRSHYDAELYRDMVSIVDAMDIDDPRWAEEAASAEIQAALHLTRRSAERELSFALELQRRLPEVWDALVCGRIDAPKARVIADRTAHLSAGAAARVVERVIDHAGRLTTGQLRARIDRLAMEYDADDAKDRYHHALTQRRVVTEPSSDGTANLFGMDLPPHRVSAISQRINRLARSLKTKDEARSMDQLRADVYLDLLQGNNHRDAAKGTVHIQTDLDTLTALANHPGELNGYGPVVSDIARQVTEELDDAEWRFSVTDAATGELVADGTTRRRPSAALRRRIETRNPTCIFPGCRMPSVDCDIDHTTRWTDGGQTTEANNAPLCRHNHITKDRLGWAYRRLPNGDYLWTSRLGHRYTTSGQPP
jgi:hypothetical protein